MKNKGISLIVLVITIVIILILAGAVILSLVENNPIKEAIEASFKNEVKSLDEQVVLSMSKEFIIDNEIMTKIITDTDSLYRFMPSLEGSMFDGKVYISDSKLTLNGSKFTEEEIQWAIEAKIKIGGLPIIKNLELLSTETTIDVKVITESFENIEKYKYKITGPNSSGEWTEQETDIYTFRNLSVGTEYIITVIAIQNKLESIPYIAKMLTKGVSEKVDIVPSPTGWTNGNVQVTISHGSIPAEYELQYKQGTGEWTKYTSTLTITENTVVKGRLYNAKLDDEIGSKTLDITNIDKIPPTTPSDIEIIKNINSLTVMAEGSKDLESGFLGYEYSIDDGATWTTSKTISHEFTGIKAETNVTVKARARDNAKNISGVKDKSEKTEGVSGFIEMKLNPIGWTSGNVTVTLTHGNIPSGYELQYKQGTGAWTKYTTALTVTTNLTNIKGRLYNSQVDDEVGASSTDITNIDKTPPTIPTDIEITQNINSLTVKGVGSTDLGSGILGYEYSIDGGTTWTVTKTDSHEFTGIKSGTNVKVTARTKDKVQNVSGIKNKTTSTGTVSNVNIVLTPIDWTSGNVQVTMTHGNIPAEYELQYKQGIGAWTKYTSTLTITENTVVKGRLYNAKLDDEIGANSKDITKIDKTPPTIPTDIEITQNINSLTVKGVGSTDSGSGILGYEYSIDGGNTWTATKTDSHEFTGIKSGTNVTITARAKDKVQNVSGVKNKTTSTGEVSSNVIITPNTILWAKNVTITMSHSNIPSGYKLQYKITGGSWIEYVSPFVVTDNTLIIGRLYNSQLDDEVGANSLDITNIDRIPPENAQITIINNDIEQDEISRISIKQTDNQTGIDIGKSKWTIGTSSTNVGNAEFDRTGRPLSQAEETISATQGTTGTYYIHVLSVDKAGNEIETISNAITIRKRIRVLEYVSYKPTISNYTSLGSLNGYSDQTFEPSKYTGGWRVYETSGEGANKKITIVSAKSVGDLTMKGITSYLNVVKTLNEISSQYVDSAFANSARSLGAANESKPVIDMSFIKYTTDINNTISDTYFNNDYDILVMKLGKNLRFDKNLWLASRSAGVEVGSYTGYHLRYIDTDLNTAADGIYSVSINGFANPDFSSQTYGVGVVINLKNGLKGISGDGTEANPYQLGF